MCNKIPKLPVTLKRCEHLFCFLCLVEEMKQKHLNKTFCPQCKENNYYDDLMASEKIDSLLKMLTLVSSA